MEDPTQRPSGVWPRDRPTRWSSVANNHTWLVVATLALLLLIVIAPFVTVAAILVRAEMGGL
jgi:hypothetical protein